MKFLGVAIFAAYLPMRPNCGCCGEWRPGRVRHATYATTATVSSLELHDAALYKTSRAWRGVSETGPGRARSTYGKEQNANHDDDQDCDRRLCKKLCDEPKGGVDNVLHIFSDPQSPFRHRL